MELGRRRAGDELPIALKWQPNGAICYISILSHLYSIRTEPGSLGPDLAPQSPTRLIVNTICARIVALAKPPSL